jgi:choline transport protein
LTTSGGLLASQLISGVILLFHPDLTLKPYQVWLIYVAWTLIAFCINAFANRLLPYFNRGAFIWSIGGFAIVCITVLACASPNYASAEFVFTDFINETGWPDGIAWLLGLLQGGFGITGYDAVAHMIEEIPNASVEGPKIMIYCVMIGTVTGFLFLSQHQGRCYRFFTTRPVAEPELCAFSCFLWVVFSSQKWLSVSVWCENSI